MSDDIREYEVQAGSTDVFGRVLCHARDQHFVVDGPIQNGCPGEAVTPAELFLAGVASCGVELIQVLARNQNMALSMVKVHISGMMNRAKPVRPDYSLFNSVHLHFHFQGIDREEASTLVEKFKAR